MLCSAVAVVLAGERGGGRASAERARAPARDPAVPGGRGARADAPEGPEEGHRQIQTLL